MVEIEFVTEEPATTETFPELATEKLKRELLFDEELDPALMAERDEDRSPDSCRNVACISVAVRGLLKMRTSSMRPLKFSPNWFAAICRVPVLGDRGPEKLEVPTATPFR